MSENPILIAVAPNGARKNKQDHPKLPLSAKELAKTAVESAKSGAGMIHFHVRDDRGHHTLDPKVYRPAIRELEAAVGDAMLLQISTESAGIYQKETQIELTKRLAPHCLSCGLLEFIQGPEDFELGHHFFSELHKSGALVQYILYSPEEVKWYETLCDQGVIPGKNHFLLFVVGRHGDTSPEEGTLHPFIAQLKQNNPWMACAFGPHEHVIASQAAQLGGHIRVGFENNHYLANGSNAHDNAAIVKQTADSVKLLNRQPLTKKFAESLYWAIA